MLLLISEICADRNIIACYKWEIPELLHHPGRRAYHHCNILALTQAQRWQRQTISLSVSMVKLDVGDMPAYLQRPPQNRERLTIHNPRPNNHIRNQSSHAEDHRPSSPTTGRTGQARWSQAELARPPIHHGSRRRVIPIGNCSRSGLCVSHPGPQR